MIFPKYRDKEGVSHMVQEQLEEVRQNIRNACERSGRKVEDVTLIAVSKTKPVPMLQEAYDAGARDFGENKVQEILEKEPQLPSDIRWHMIGHLQKNKVRQVIDKAVLIHSVDKVGLAEQIEKERSNVIWMFLFFWRSMSPEKCTNFVLPRKKSRKRHAKLQSTRMSTYRDL